MFETIYSFINLKDYHTYKDKIFYGLSTNKIRFSKDFNGYFRVIEEGIKYSLCSYINGCLLTSMMIQYRLYIPNNYIKKCLIINNTIDVLKSGSILDEYKMYFNPNFTENKELEKELGFKEAECFRQFLPIEYLLNENDDISAINRLYNIENNKNLSDIIKIRKVVNVPNFCNKYERELYEEAPF